MDLILLWCNLVHFDYYR